MYERSAIVLERYMEKILNLNKPNNLKKNSENYTDLIQEIEEYQIMTEKEQKVIQEFDETVKTIENIQVQQESIYKVNKQLEEERAVLFQDLGENAKSLDNKLKRIEDLLEKNNEKLKELREEFIRNLSDFSQKQKDRNKGEKAKRLGEARHIEYIKRMQEDFSAIDQKDVIDLKNFINSDKEEIKEKALEIMIKNGKSEKVAFNQEVLKKAIDARIDIAQKEAECYIQVFEKMRRLISEQDIELIKLSKYQKTYRDTSVKLAFLKEEKEYIVSFLDYERMTAISGTRTHNRMMNEACNNFDLDMAQIKNLYNLILKEIMNKATKKAYKELYNKTYLRNIEDKEKNFEKEANQVNISMGTVINSNYWRIEGIKNIYNIFQQEVSEKFEKDLSEYRIEDLEEIETLEEQEIEEEYEDDDFEDNFEIDNYEEDEIEEDNEENHETEEDEDDDFEEEYNDEEDLDEEEYDEEEEEDDDDDEYDEEYDEDEYDEVEEYDEEYEEDEDEDEDENEKDEKDFEDVVYDEEEEESEKKRKKRKASKTFEDEDIDLIIEKSRKKGNKRGKRAANNKGLFDKLFKK